MTKKQRKITRFSLISTAAALLAFIIIFNPILVCLIWGNVVIDVPLLIISIFFPFFVAIICGLISEYFKEFTKEDALRQLEYQFNKGLIDIEHFKQQYKHIELFDMEKKQIWAQMKIERKKLDNDIKLMAKNAVDKMKEEASDEGQEN